MNDDEFFMIEKSLKFYLKTCVILIISNYFINYIFMCVTFAGSETH